MAALSLYLAESRFQRIAPHIYGDVLDVGCQSGQLRDRLSRQISSYTGVDISQDAIDEARRKYPMGELRRLDLEVEPMEFEDRFDSIILSAVIEHIFNLKFLGNGLAQSLKPGGCLVITTPTNFGNDVVHRAGSLIGLFSKVARDDHISIFNRKRFDIFATECGLEVELYKRFQFGCNQLVVLRKNG